MRVAALVVSSTLVLTLAGCAGSPKAPARAGPAATPPATTAGAAPAPGMPAAPSRGVVPPPAISLQAPTSGDYKLAPKDQITVTVLGQDDLTRTVRVSESGTITLPMLGEVAVAGLTPADAEAKITSGLKGKYLVNPRVTVTVAEYQGRQVSVMGAVTQPGSYSLKTNGTTLLVALSEAKGVREGADRVAYVVRANPRQGEPQPLTVDLDALLRAGDPRHNVVMEAGDSVYVPEANTFYVAGEVEKRGAYPLRRDTTLSKALTEAGGVTKRAATGEIKIVRTLPTGEKQEIGAIDLQAVMAGDKSQDVPLLAQDVVVVPASGAKVAAYGVLDFLRGLFSIGIVP
jgi:polysaccharide export outer membrane protein